MANFSTHLNVSAFVSGVGATLVTYSGIASKEDGIFYFFAGIVGGLLPDIDHDKSTPLKIMQFFFSNLIAFLVTYKFIGNVPILNIALMWAGAYFLTTVVFYFFKKLTTHRGMIHSIPAAFLSWFLISLIAYKYWNMDIQKSYLLGFFVFLGYITHLVLDEIYSVDLTGRKIKKSFGSALKFCSTDKTTNLIFISTLLIMFLFLPQKEMLFSIIKGLIHV